MSGEVAGAGAESGEVVGGVVGSEVMVVGGLTDLSGACQANHWCFGKNLTESP